MKMWLVGAGYWGQKLLTTLQKFGVEAQIVDIKNGQTIDDITDTSPVMLATPLWNHYDQCCQLISRGHDVYVEKPMAETVGEIFNLKMLCAPGQLVMVGHIFQHHPQRDEIKVLLGLGAIGDLQHISSRRMNWGIYQTRTDPVLSLGTHDISIVLDMADTTDAVVDQSRAYYVTKGQRPDRVQWNGRCGTVTFDCDVSWAWPVRSRETVLIGTNGQIVWDQDANTYTVSRHQIVNARANLDQASYTVSYQHKLSPLEHEVRHWIDCLRDRISPSTGFDQALAVAQVIQQINIP